MEHMDFPDPDLSIWAFCGGYVVRQDGEGTTTRVCMTRAETLTHVDSILADRDDNGAAEAAERALRGR